jgi:hypothetical protein
MMPLSDGAVIILVITLIATFPAWPYSRKWGYLPSAGVSMVLLTLLIVLVARTV